MANLKSLNTVASKYQLVLVKGEGYYYWCGLDDDIQNKLSSLFTTSVYIYKFSQLPFDRWLDELEMIKKQLTEQTD